MELQHINIKLFLENLSPFNLEELVPVFHGWIQDQACEDLLIDVADYRHVHAGPGVVLIGHEGDYSLDNTDNRLGVRYNRKKAMNGNNRDRFAQALRAALKACQKLESDERLQGKLRFGGRALQLFVNDRLLAPNSDATFADSEPELRSFFGEVFGSDDFEMVREQDSRRLFGVEIKMPRPLDTGELLGRVPV
jgi:hypothetical protein